MAERICNALDGNSNANGAVALPEAQREAIEQATRAVSPGLMEALGGRNTARDAVSLRVWDKNTVPDPGGVGSRRKAAAEYQTVSGTGEMRSKSFDVRAHKGLYQADEDYLDDAEAGIESLWEDGLAEDFASSRANVIVNGAGTANLFEGMVVNIKDGTAVNYNAYSAANAFQGLFAVKSGVNGALGNESSSGAGDADIQAVNNLIDLVASVPSRWAGGRMVWVMNRRTLAAVRKLRDANGQSLYQANFSGNGQDPMTQEILGYPVLLLDHMPGLNSSAASVPIGFGNLGAYMKFFPRRELSLETFKKPDIYEFYLEAAFRSW